MGRQQLFSFRMVPGIAGMLVRRGLDPAELLREVGLPLEAMTGEVTAPLGRIRDLLERAAVVLKQPLLGLDLVVLVPTGMFGLSEFVGRFAPTVGRGLEMFCASAPLVNPMIEWRYVAGPDEHELQLSVPGSRDGLGTQLNEYSVAIVLKLAMGGLDRPLDIARAWFAHPRPDRAQANEVGERLGCPVEFAQASCGLAFSAAEAQRAPRMADPALFEFHIAQTRSRLASLGTDDVIAHVSRMIEMRLPSGDLQVESIASALAITARTLQRRLTDAGTSYRNVLVHVRRRRRAELERDGLAEAKIAELLGFPDVRAMRRSLAVTEH
jgi:AraC-like DNA-binding protein